MTRTAAAQHPLAAIGVAPRCLNRLQAAAYVCVSPRLFDELVSDRRMPSAKRINARVIWDIRQLDAAIDKLPNDDQRDTDDDSNAHWGQFKA